MARNSIEEQKSILSYLLQSFIVKKGILSDYFHVISSYCLPGLFSAILSIFYTWHASEQSYGLTIYAMFPGRSPKANSSDSEEILLSMPCIRPGDGQSAEKQALLQLVSLLITLFFSSAVGLLSGFGIRCKYLDLLEPHQMFCDETMWQIRGLDIQSSESNYDTETGDELRTVHETSICMP